MQDKPLSFWPYLTRRAFLKVVIYGTLLYTFGFFLVEDWLASAHTYKEGITLNNLAAAFSASVDSFAWLILLAVFELETWQLDDTKLKGFVPYLFAGVSILAYGVVLLAFAGYYDLVIILDGFKPLSQSAESLCALDTTGDLSLALGPDKFETLSKETCRTLDFTGMLYNPDSRILSNPDVYRFMDEMAWTDVINAFTWLIVVFILQIDVWLELGKWRNKYVVTISNILKAGLYFILAACCVFWLWSAQFADGIDALFWLLAFFLIELNLIDWHQENDTELGAIS